MNRRRIIILAIAVLLLGGFAVYSGRTREPVYEGRTLTSWLNSYHIAHFTNDAEADKSKAAILSIGTNGIPTLLKLNATKDLPGANLFKAFVKRSGVSDYETPAERKHELAYLGFNVLGSKAKSFAPLLIDRFLRSPVGTRDDTLDILNCIEPENEIMGPLITRLAGQSSFTRFQVHVIAMHPVEAEKAGFFKKFPAYRQYYNQFTNNISTNAPVAR